MDAIVGFHNWPQLATGSVGYHAGAVMASSDAFDIVLTGRGGHAAHPHTTIDTLAGAAQLVTQLQTVVSREIAPMVPAVLTVGQIEGGTARNLVAGRVVLRGTARALDETAAGQIEAAVRRITAGLGAAMRLGHEITWTRLAPVLKNDQRTLARVLASTREVLGEARVLDLGPASMGSEDFAWFAERIPAAHLKIGSKSDGLDTAIHRADYECNEAAIPLGVRVITRAVLDLLREDR